MRSRKPREPVYIGKGQETTVWSSKRGEKESAIVVKEYGGIGQERMRQLEAQYKRLRSVYGELIPSQRFVKKKDEAGTVVLAQERIHPAKTPNVLDHKQGTLPPKAQQQLERLVQVLRAQWRIFVQDKDAVDQYTLLDFAKKDNLLMTQDGDIRFVDTGILQEYSRLTDDRAVRMIQTPIAIMELITGRSGEEIMSDPEYSGLVQDFRMRGSMYEDKSGMTAFENFIHSAYDGKGSILM